MQDIQNGFDRGSQVGLAGLPQLGVDRDHRSLRLAQLFGISWDNDFYSLPSLFSDRTAYAMEVTYFKKSEPYSADTLKL